MRTTAMIMAILLAAYFLNFVITSIGLTARSTDSSPASASRRCSS